MRTLRLLGWTAIFALVACAIAWLFSDAMSSAIGHRNWDVAMALIAAASAWLLCVRAWRKDQTLLARREHEMAATAARFKAALDHLPQGVTMFDAQRRLVVSNDRYLRMFELSADVVKPGATVDEIRQHRMESGQPVLSDYIDATGGVSPMPPHREGDILRTVETWSLKDGRTVTTSRYPMPGGGWVAMHEDITGRLRREQEIRTARLFLDTVLGHVPNAIAVKDPRTLRYTLVNREFEHILGMQEHDILGRKAEALFDGKTAALIEARDREALTLAGSQTLVHEGPVQMQTVGERRVRSKRIVVRNSEGLATHLIAMFEDVTEQRAQEDHIVHLAQHDSLTSLANRARFKDLTDAALKADPGSEEKPSRVAVAFLDLDGFKEINDTFGHAVGDEVLRVTADRIRMLCKGQALAARLGGDEFALLFANGSGAAAIGETLTALLARLRAPIQCDESIVVIDASAGVAFARDTGADPEDLSRQADIALYEAKAAGKGVWRKFEPAMRLRRTSRKALESEMRRAIAHKEFEVHYQPIVDLRSGEITSMEALARWRHPERGLVSPAEFIPVAEETGMILEIGEIVLAQACAAATQWPEHVRVSVNLSPVQFRDRRLAQKVAATLRGAGLSASRLEMEITEAALLHDTADNMHTLKALRDEGIRIVMDDFGTGYSSLNYLRSFPFDKIKIDRSYIRDIAGDNHSSRTILGAVLALAAGLELSTTAEGVETREQMDMLRAAGCTEMQGFYFSRPVPECDVAAFFKQADRAGASAA